MNIKYCIISIGLLLNFCFNAILEGLPPVEDIKNFQTIEQFDNHISKINTVLDGRKYGQILRPKEIQLLDSHLTELEGKMGEMPKFQDALENPRFNVLYKRVQAQIELSKAQDTRMAKFSHWANIILVGVSIPGAILGVVGYIIGKKLQDLSLSLQEQQANNAVNYYNNLTSQIIGVGSGPSSSTGSSSSSSPESSPPSPSSSSQTILS